MTNGTHVGISTAGAGAYNGPTFAAATPISGFLPMAVLTNAANTGGNYILRVYNGSQTCFDEVTVNVPAVACPQPCTQPSGAAFTQDVATCVSGVASNNGQIRLSAVTNATHFGVSALNAGSYNGPTYTSATMIGVLPQAVHINVPNTGGTYIVRLYNGSNDCFIDQTITVTPQVCVPACTTPSGIAFSQSAPTCTGANPGNNGSISLTAYTDGTHYGVSTLNAGSYNGPTTIGTATAIPGALPAVVRSSIPNTGGTYIIRIFNGADGCYTDRTLTVNTVTCCLGAPCITTTAVKN